MYTVGLLARLVGSHIGVYLFIILKIILSLDHCGKSMENWVLEILDIYRQSVIHRRTLLFCHRCDLGNFFYDVSRQWACGSQRLRCVKVTSCQAR